MGDGYKTTIAVPNYPGTILQFTLLPLVDDFLVPPLHKVAHLGRARENCRRDLSHDACLLLFSAMAWSVTTRERRIGLDTTVSPTVLGLLGTHESTVGCHVLYGHSSNISVLYERRLEVRGGMFSVRSQNRRAGHFMSVGEFS